MKCPTENHRTCDCKQPTHSMLTHLRIKNFKRFPDADINWAKRLSLSGRTTPAKPPPCNRLRCGCRPPQMEPRIQRPRPFQQNVPRPVTINRRRSGSHSSAERKSALAKPPCARTSKRPMATGLTETSHRQSSWTAVSGGKSWSCGLEFDYANDKSLYCRPLRLNNEKEFAAHACPRKRRRL